MTVYEHLLKLLFSNENTDVSRADNSIKNWWNLPISNPKPDLHNINAHTKFGKKSIDIYWSYHLETKIQMYDRQMEVHTDNQCESIIARHYHAAGYKNDNFELTLTFFMERSNFFTQAKL